jgi:uncharacterized protein (UPF0332 family)
LPLADRLAGFTEEAAHRSAISRAYYAAYHAAEAFVRAKGILTSGHTHQKVWDALVNDPDHARANVGVRGKQLNWIRVMADYRAPFPGDIGKELRAAIAEARGLVADLARLS